MKGYFSIVLFLIAGSFLTAQKIDFDTSSSWEKLQSRAKKQNKYLFVDCYTEWCGWCKVMDKETFTDKNIAAYMNEHFIAAKIDMEKDYGINLSMKYRITGFPSFIIFSPDGKLVYKTFGFQKPEKFISELENALNQEKQLQLRGVSDVVDLDFPAFYKKAFAGNGKRIFPTAEIIDSFYNSRISWTDEVTFNVMSRFKMPEKVKEYFLTELEQFRYLYDKEVDQILSRLSNEKLKMAMDEADEKLLMDAVEFTSKYLPEESEEQIKYMKLTFWSNTENWQKFAVEFQSLLETEPFNQPSTINSYCWDIYENCNDPEVIANACSWMERAINMDPQYAYLDTYAALLFKNKQFDQAEKYAKLAIKTGLENKEDVQSTEELLQKIQDSK